MRKKLIKRSERPVCPGTGGHFKAEWGDSLNAERLAIFAEMPMLPKYRLAILYIKTNQLAKAQKTAISILKQPVKVQSKITDSIRKSMRIFLDLQK